MPDTDPDYERPIPPYIKGSDYSLMRVEMYQAFIDRTPNVPSGYVHYDDMRAQVGVTFSFGSGIEYPLFQHTSMTMEEVIFMAAARGSWHHHYRSPPPPFNPYDNPKDM